jgi:hypothetical protein
MIVLEQLTTRKKTPFTLADFDQQIRDKTIDANRDMCRVVVEIRHSRASKSVTTYGVMESNADFMGSRLVFPTSRFNLSSKEREEVTMEALSFVIPARKVETPTSQVPKWVPVTELLNVIGRTETNCRKYGRNSELMFQMPLVADIRSSDGTSKSWFITRVEFDEFRQILFLICDLVDSERTDAYRILKDFESPCVRTIDAELGE